MVDEETGAKPEKPVKVEPVEKPEKPARKPKPEKQVKAEGTEKPEKPARKPKATKGEAAGKAEKPGKAEKAAEKMLEKVIAEAAVKGEAPAGAPAKEEGEKTPRLLFNRWDLNEVEVTDPGIKRYINLQSMIVPHSSGRLSTQQFAKSEMLIVERLINRLMQNEMNTGKKHMAIRITREAFEIINRKTKKNPVQVLVDAVAQAGPREETVRLKYGGINVPKSVDTAPLRRVNTALMFICNGVYAATHKNRKYVSDCLADELIAAAKGDTKCYSVSKKEERERVAKASR
jgi:small subunit ribosomal protein S7